ncbi:family 7 extracellular solute-binding protein [Nitratireductor indicus C115]|uniref:Family 7 extracellular solute-binding protein n=1 Tax=Nitratireductor indicus C115 TaxID=1231190 RepID=K2MY56_9HYPH|nr:TRAP transporter substrate-binding protein [Nitratireductor indicus]EKF40138.1 family 7 extracellular solute-binding protein [Nitratireductor indicus C115]SFQ81363.1 TRAP-type C4-dicarboxylate transport system, substrate-binding protein [Nitratireductor indicus]
MSLKRLLRVVALASVTVASAGSAFAATQWTMASGYPESSFFTKNIRKFIEAVEERTKGELKIDLRSNDSLIKLDNIKRAVQSGQVQIGEIRMGVYGNEQEMFNLDNIPGVVPTFDKSWKLMEAQKPYYDQWFGRNGMRVITYVAWPGQGFFTKEPIGSLDDLKGVKLRIYSQQTQIMGEKLGTEAIILPFAEVPQAFATGMIQALWTSAQSGTDVQVWDYLKVFTYTGTMHNKNAVIVNERALRGLPEDVRQIVIEEGEAATARGWEMAKEASKEREDILKEHGMALNEAPKDVLDRIDEIGKEMVQDWMTRASDEEKAVYEAYQASLD